MVGMMHEFEFDLLLADCDIDNPALSKCAVRGWM